MSRSRVLSNASGLPLLCELLESRQLLAPTLSNFAATPSLVLAGNSITLATDAFSVDGVRAVTFFRDADLNGRWTPGFDEAIGDVFVRDSNTLKYQKTLAAPAAWGRNARILADVVDNNGVWSTGPLPSVVVTVNRAPQILTFDATPMTLNTGQSVTFNATASDDAAVRAVTFFIDRDNSGRFTPGLDSPLGTDFTSDAFGRYSLTTSTDSTWPLNARILCDAQDFDGQWAITLGGLTLRVGVPTPPTINVFTATTGRGTTSPTVRLQANVSDNLGVRAVTFFQDMDSNGIWSQGVDLSLGTLFAHDVGSPGQYTLTVPTDFAGQESGRFVVDVSDVDGTWCTTPGVAIAAREQYRFIQTFTAEMLGAALARVSATAWIPPFFGTPFADVEHVMFAQDINGNDRYDAGVDIDLGVETTRTQAGNAYFFEKFAAVDGTQPLPLRFIAAVPLTANLLWSDPTGPVRLAQGRGQSNIPTIDSIAVSAGLNPTTNAQTFVNPGTKYSFTVDATANAGIDAVSFFFDRNMNGRWDPALDIDLGFLRAPAGTFTATFVKSGIIPAGATGFGAFTAVVKDLSGRPGDEWGPTRALTVSPVFAVPQITAPTAPSVARGNPLIVNFTAGDDFGVRAVSAFLDVNNNGLDASDKTATTYTRISGTPVSGQWRLSIDTTGLAAGNYTVYISGLDFYRGSASAPGGVSTGFWGPRRAINITIT